MDVTYSESGNLISIEQVIKETDLPGSVKSVILGKNPGAKFEKIERITTYADDAVKDLFFETLLDTAANKKVEVKLGAEWKIVETEEKSARRI